MAAIHHATVARAARAGFEITEIDGRFGLRRIADGATSRDTFDTAQHAAAMARDLTDEQLHLPVPVDIETGDMQPLLRTKSGVMVGTYHDRYTQNGGGCGDNLDEAMRAAYTDGTGKTLNTEALQADGEAMGLWNPAWASLNPGMRRMNLANRIRGYLRNHPDATVRIGDTEGRFGIAPKAPKGK